MAMPDAASMQGAAPPPSIPPAMTLRSLLDSRRDEGRRMSLEEAIAVIVPVCMDLQERHTRGERLYVHPSAIAPGPDGIARLRPKLALVPTNQSDKHCLAPELQRTLEPGDACSSVYSVGAMLYEMVTGEHVGPAMRRPRDIDPGLPDALEALIGKAIIGDRHHRPADLGALASAMYHVAPQKSIHPPDVSESQLDGSAQEAVDVRFSMMPPNPHAQQQAAAPAYSNGDPYAAPIIDRTAPAGGKRRGADDPTAQLAALKAQLESDPRPRYVVSKDSMDHGPFSAVELLQQIGSNQFTADHLLRDELSGEQHALCDWEEFAPFARQAGLVREKKAEERAVVRAADVDKKRGIAKTIIGVSVVIALAGVLAVWFTTRRGTRNESVTVAKDRAGSVQVNGDIKGKAHAAGAGGHGGMGGYSGGMSYEAVLNSNVQEITMGEQSGGPDLTNAQLSGPLMHASFVPNCGAPDDMHVQVRVAVKMGVPIGVTVSTSPPSGGVAACIDRAVRGLRWPAHPKTDFVTTNY
jgi:hypothetical protein